MKKIFTLTLFLLSLALTGVAQIITTSPAILQEASQNVVLTYNAASPQGNDGLKGLSSSTAVYAHIGAITNLSTNNSDWKYAPTWGDNAAKYKLTYTKANTYTLKIGDLRSFFGITNANEHIEKIALVFRTGDNKKEGKTKSGGDIFVDVYPAGFQMQFTSDAASTVLSKETSIKFTVTTSEAGNLSIAVNGTDVASATGKTTLTTTYKFSSTGAYKVTAKAVKGDQTLTNTINIAYPGKSDARNYPGGVPKMGYNRQANGDVIFCFAAPQKQSVVLVPSWDNYEVLDKNIMHYQDYSGNRYFWTTVSGLEDNTWYPYYYIVDATYKVADPYAHLVLDPYSDKWINESVWPTMPKYPYELFDDTMLAVYRHNSEPYKWSEFTIPDHKALTVYELLVRDFTGTDGQADASGTFNKAYQKLWYLRSLGVNCIELMPIMEFNGNSSWGYNTNFYMAPDKNYGSPQDLKNFIDRAHQLGMAIVLDIVFNQSDGLHPWYQIYGGVENNPFYNPTAPHDYSVLNDWNQKNDLVRQQWRDVLKYWMTEYNVDGFRFDLVKGLGTDYPSGTENYNQTRVQVMNDLQTVIKGVKPDGIHINENFAQAKEENEMAANGQLNWYQVNNNSCQFAMGFATQSKLSDFLATNVGRTAYSTVSFAESHDEQRMGYKQEMYGANGIKGSGSSTLRARMNRLGQVAVQMLMTPGPHMIWQFGELGDSQNTKNDDGGNNTDPKKVVWNYLDNADRANLHHTYAALCNLRTQHPEMFNGGATFETKAWDTDNISNARTMRLVSGDKEVVALINPRIGTGTQQISIATTKITSSNYEVVCTSKGYDGKLTQAGSSIRATVPANGYVVYSTKNISGVEDIIADGAADGSLRATVRGGIGEIVIDGEYDHVSVYNLSGRAMSGLQVAKGLYIVNVDGHVTKVAVK